MKAFLIWVVSYIVKRWVLRFPSNWSNSEQVRVFIVHNGDTLRLLSEQTETNIDDRLVEYVVALANNKIAWNLAFNTIVQVVNDGSEGALLPDGETDAVRPLRTLLARIRNWLSEAGA